MAGDEEVVTELIQAQRDLILADADTADMRLAGVLEVIAARLFDPSFKTKSLEQASGLSRFTLQRDFGDSFGKSIKGYVTSHRLEVAGELLQKSDLRISEIAVAIGYKSTNGFSRAFSREYGRTPMGHRLSARMKPQDPVAVKRVLEDRERRERRVLETLWRVHGPGLLDWLGDVGDGKKWADETEIFYFLKRMSLEGCRDNRQLGVRVAALTLELLESCRHRLPGSEFDRLKFECLLGLGNAHRLTSDLDEADKCFSMAEAEIVSGRVPGSMRASLLLFKGHLRTFQRRHSEASLLLAEAREILQEQGEPTRAVQAGMALGYSQILRGRLKDALSEYCRAREIIEGMKRRDPYLLFSVYSGIAAIRINIGDLFEAGESLRRAEMYAQDCGSEMPLHIVLWQSGLLAAQQGHNSRARDLLRRAMEGISAAGDLGNAALLAVDLALVCLRDGSARDAGESIKWAVPILQSLGLQGECLSCVRVLTEADRQNSLSVDMLIIARSCLQIEFFAPFWEPASPTGQE